MKLPSSGAPRFTGKPWVRSPQRILIFDMETLPNKFYLHGRRVASGYMPHEPAEYGCMFSWAAQWYGDTAMHSDRLEAQEVRDRFDDRIANSLAKMIDDADIVVAHNADRFDVPELRTSLLGTRKLSNLVTFDTLKVARKYFRFRGGNSLRNLSPELGIPYPKIYPPHRWGEIICETQDPAVMAEVDHYGQQDVRVLVPVYGVLREYAP